MTSLRGAAAGVLIAGVLALAICAAETVAPEESSPSAVVLEFHNRSAMSIALYPTAIVEACSSMVFDQRAVALGKARLQEEFLRTGSFDAWVPPGAVRYSAGIPGRPIDATEPMTVVVSSKPLKVALGSIRPSDLPPCGGAPVGVD